MEPLIVRSAGRTALAALSGSGALVVVAAFARSFYLRDAAGRLTCFGGPGLGDGPLNALVAGSLRVPAPGTRLGATNFDLAQVVVWRPPDVSWAPSDLRGRLAAIAQARLRGLALAVPALLGAPFDAGGDPFLAAAWPGLAALRDWAAGTPPDALSGLLGLGPGLTPAGDDALGGAAIALRLSGRKAQADALADWIAANAPAATSEIALAHLRAAASGEGAAALHAALEALGSGRDPDLAAIDSIGHSSGWDALAGVVAVLAQA